MSSPLILKSIVPADKPNCSTAHSSQLGRVRLVYIAMATKIVRVETLPAVSKIGMLLCRELSTAASCPQTNNKLVCVHTYEKHAYVHKDTRTHINTLLLVRKSVTISM